MPLNAVVVSLRESQANLESDGGLHFVLLWFPATRWPYVRSSWLEHKTCQLRTFLFLLLDISPLMSTSDLQSMQLGVFTGPTWAELSFSRRNFNLLSAFSLIFPFVSFLPNKKDDETVPLARYTIGILT